MTIRTRSHGHVVDPVNGATGSGSRLGDTRDLVIKLSSWSDEGASSPAASVLLDRPGRDAAIDALLFEALRQKTLPAVLHHLERAGGDLEELTVEAALTRSTWPLSEIVPHPPDAAPARVSLAALSRTLQHHRALLRSAVLELLDAAEEPFVQISGSGFEAAYPAYRSRLYWDVDLIVADLPRCLDILELLLRLGYGMLRAKLAEIGSPGLGAFSVARQNEGHSIRVGVMAGAYKGRLWARAPIIDRSRRVAFDGRWAHVPSPEDLLLMAALRAQRKRGFVQRDVNDVRFVITHENGRLDWGYLTEAAIAHGVRGTLRRLMDFAETQDGRDLVPSSVGRRIAPDGLERALIYLAFDGTSRGGLRGSPGRGGYGLTERAAIRLWSADRAFRSARSRVGTPAAVRYVIGERLDGRLFSLRSHLAASPSRPLRRALPVVRGISPNYGSFCELTSRTAAPASTPCLSRTPALRRRPPTSMLGDGGETLRRLLELLRTPPPAVPRMDDLGSSPHDHRCWHFMFGLGPSRSMASVSESP